MAVGHLAFAFAGLVVVLERGLAVRFALVRGWSASGPLIHPIVICKVNRVKNEPDIRGESTHGVC